MIYLEVIKSKDPLALGVYEYHFDQVTIGRSKKNDLIFLDKELPLLFLSIKFINEQLVIQSNSRFPFFFVNEKKVSGTLKLKPSDVIAFGNNAIRIIKSEITNQPADFATEYDDFIQNFPELKFSLDFIEQVILEMEKDSNV